MACWLGTGSRRAQSRARVDARRPGETDESDIRACTALAGFATAVRSVTCGGVQRQQRRRRAADQRPRTRRTTRRTLDAARRRRRRTPRRDAPPTTDRGSASTPAAPTHDHDGDERRRAAPRQASGPARRERREARPAAATMDYRSGAEPTCGPVISSADSRDLPPGDAAGPARRSRTRGYPVFSVPPQILPALKWERVRRLHDHVEPQPGRTAGPAWCGTMRRLQPDRGSPTSGTVKTKARVDDSALMVDRQGRQGRV